MAFDQQMIRPTLFMGIVLVCCIIAMVSDSDFLSGYRTHYGRHKKHSDVCLLIGTLVVLVLFILMVVAGITNNSAKSQAKIVFMILIAVAMICLILSCCFQYDWTNYDFGWAISGTAILAMIVIVLLLDALGL